MILQRRKSLEFNGITLFIALFIASFSLFLILNIQRDSYVSKLNLRRIKGATKTDFAAYIAEAIRGYETELRQAILSQDKEKIEEIENRINALKIDPRDILPGDVKMLEEFRNSPQYSESIKEAIYSILSSKIIPELFFAGAASRLFEDMKRKDEEVAKRLAGPMYFVDIWAIAEALGHKIPENALRGIGMGPRQLIQLRIKLTQLAEENGKDPHVVLSNYKIVLHINSEIEDRVREDLVRYNFYGFNPENVIIIVQPFLPGYEIDERNNVVLASNSERIPYGHGYAVKQMEIVGEGYTIDRQNNKTIIPTTVKVHLLNMGVEKIVYHRVNDLTKWTDKVLDIEMLAFALYLMKGGEIKRVVPLVKNIPDESGKFQKGGLFLKNRETGLNFLLETLNSKTPEIQKRLDELNEKLGWLPYNSFRQITDLKALDTSRLRNNIRVRGRFNIYLEWVTGDLDGTEWANSVGIMREGEVIQDFKELNNLPLALNYLISQDSNPEFRRVVFELGF